MDMLINRMEEILATGWPLKVKLKEGIKAHIEMVVGEMSLVTVALGQEFELEENYCKLSLPGGIDTKDIFAGLSTRGLKKGSFARSPVK